MRTVPLRGGGGILQAADVRTEIRAIHRVSSEFVCPVKFQYDTGTERHLISDYMPWPLFSYLQLERRFTEETTRFYISELILALGAFHERGLILGRLRPENIMLNAMGNLVISNFGLPLHKLPSLTDIEYDGITFGEYTPPEAIHNKESQLNRSYDFWTLGCFIFEMACGWSPFFAEDPAQMFANITSGKMLFPRGAMSKEGRDVIKGLLNRNPLHRLGSENGIMELMMHPWFSGTDWENFTKRYTETPIKPNLQSITSDHLEHQHVLEHEPHSTSTFGVSTFSSAQYSLDSGLGMSSRYNSMLSTPLSYDSALGMPSPLRKTRMKELVYVDNDEVEHRIDEEDEVERLLV